MTLLTIGIPTYNRAAQLSRLLADILPMCQQLGIEVLVSDNNSSDPTPMVIRQFQNFGCLRSLRNQSNLGFDGNVLKLIEQAHGEFLWLMGDDDRLVSSALPALVKLIAENREAGLYYINYLSSPWTPKGEGPLQVKQLTPQSYLDEYLHRASLISTNIFNLNLVKGFTINQACLHHGWIHLHLLLLLAEELQARGAKITIVRNCLVSQGLGMEPEPITKWEKAFVDNFPFTVEQTPARSLKRHRFIKHFYDINIRPTYLTLAKLLTHQQPLALYRKIAKFYRPNWSGRLSFWLQYNLLWKPARLFWPH
ncbi:hypothetical protein A2311_00510 [candidate division WOR-1 bacterium RIFOXYB2_FULL_48_7]|uniref:Glycosyltransferase 2-like domain-containing protein n=1 Tax=candidate division WOR-1 bacterium RIFOXYB2_FULL_48_7 TaxID=1802583 RepID=A0A1F4TTQ5_UNCSA|nr:MAG: hypothetical protein A2311_00510 [candidate division WOR-1 bacterium RIFOXYB2_FULL_48_7]